MRSPKSGLARRSVQKDKHVLKLSQDIGTPYKQWTFRSSAKSGHPLGRTAAQCDDIARSHEYIKLIAASDFVDLHCLITTVIERFIVQLLSALNGKTCY